MSDESRPKFRHVIIDPQTIQTGNSVSLVADTDGDGFVDVTIGNLSEMVEAYCRCQGSMKSFQGRISILLLLDPRRPF